MGVHSDGLVYIFVDGCPVGEGIDLATADDIIGYVDENNNIVLTGTLPDSTYTVKYEMDDGSTVDIGDLVLGEVEPDEPVAPSYTNLANPNDAYWKDGYRLSISGGGTIACDGHTVTNFIPAKLDDIVRVKGMSITTALNGQESKIVLYSTKDNEGSKLGGMYGSTATTEYTHYGSKVSVNGDISEYKLFYDNNGMQTQINANSANYIRIDGVLLDGYTADDVIITINEEIV